MVCSLLFLELLRVIRLILEEDVSKALEPIEVTLSGMVIEANDVLAKALLPMVASLEGLAKVISVNRSYLWFNVIESNSY